MKLPSLMSAIPGSILSSVANHHRPSVGVRYFQATDKHPPLRIFYPKAGDNASAGTGISKSLNSPGWFQDTGIVSFLTGYLHTVLFRKDTWKFKYLAIPLIHLLSWVLPLRWKKIPGLYQDVKCAKKDGGKKFPLIVFSHGLTGTGQENTVLAAAWAQRGFVVVSVHHTDGSSCHVRLADGSAKYYEHPPPMSDYDPTFRPNQLQVRAREMIQALKFVTTSGNCPKDIQDAVDPDQAMAAGFSFGAATTALATVQEPVFQAALFLDGWFHIDVMKSAGVEFCLPEEAFERGIRVPCLFINSEQFAGYSKLFAATQELASKSGSPPGTDNVVVIPGTGHQNFCDVIFWFRASILRRLMRGAIGEADPNETFLEIVERSADFLLQAVQSKNKERIVINADA